MPQECLTTNQKVMLLACSGASNVGQLANQAAVELAREGFGKMFCLAGVGARLSEFVRSASEAPVLVAIDGCPVGCAKKILEHAEVPLKSYVAVTNLGIEKNTDTKLKREEMDKVKGAVKETLDRI